MNILVDLIMNCGRENFTCTSIYSTVEVHDVNVHVRNERSLLTDIIYR